MKTETVAGIEYSYPKVTILQETGLGVSEIAARTCYDSFEASENTSINRYMLDEMWKYPTDTSYNDIDSSDLLTSLAWVHHHHSILEHTNIAFHIQGTSRGVLQEFARHRMQAISVKSTRYTMSSVINAFVASIKNISTSRTWFISQVLTMDMFIVTDLDYSRIEIGCIYDKLLHQAVLGSWDEFTDISIAKSSIPLLDLSTQDEIFKALQSGKKKRNVGDAFKHIVSDIWKVDLVSTMNLRALKNFLDLRDSGAAYFQIRHLAQEMKEALPQKYLDLIVKSK